MKPFHLPIFPLRSPHQFSFHPIDLFLLTFGLGCLGILGPKTIHKVLEMIDLSLLVFVYRKLLLFMGIPLLKERIIITCPAKESFAADFQNPLYQLI